jgi:hypothetical protein
LEIYEPREEPRVSIASNQGLWRGSEMLTPSELLAEEPDSLAAAALERTASSLWRNEINIEFFEILRTMGSTTQRTANGMSRLRTIASNSM